VPDVAILGAVACRCDAKLGRKALIALTIADADGIGISLLAGAAERLERGLGAKELRRPVELGIEAACGGRRRLERRRQEAARAFSSPMKKR
jgi:hypothetical protein